MNDFWLKQIHRIIISKQFIVLVSKPLTKDLVGSLQLLSESMLWDNEAQMVETG